MKRSWTIPLLLVAAICCCAAPSHGALIDDFSNGTLVNTSVPPTQFLNQSGLSGVIGTGERSLEWGLATVIVPPLEEIDLDINHFASGSAILNSGTFTQGFWAFSYGNLTPFDMDLTDAGASNAFVAQLGPSDGGMLFAEANDTSLNFENHGVAFPALPSGGLVAVPFSLFSSLDFHHITNLSLEIDGVAGGHYEVQLFNTQHVVPEPSGFVLFGVGAFGLVFAARRRRECGE